MIICQMFSSERWVSLNRIIISVFPEELTPQAVAAVPEPLLRTLEETANAVLLENGVDYGAKAYFVTDYFDTRAYGDFTLPAGAYTALRIVLGAGNGQNWWCVMFPPLCLPAAGGVPPEAVFDRNEWQVVQPEAGYQIRFRLVEIFEALWKKWDENKENQKK